MLYEIDPLVGAGYKDCVDMMKLAAHVADVVVQRTGVPIGKLSEDDTKSLLKIEAEIKELIIGQTEAVSAISRALRF